MMNRLGFIVAAAAMLAGAATPVDPVQNLLGKFSAAWEGTRTYQCTIASRELKGSRVQDRVYLIRFSKPLDTRIDIVSGDERGSAAVWRGGNRVRGHQGGILAAIRLNVDIH